MSVTTGLTAGPAAATSLPASKDVRDILEALLGRECDLADGARVVDGRGLVACYVDDALRLRALVAMDLPLAAVSGAAIGLLPRGRVADAVEARQLDDVLRENAVEVCNVLVSLFNVPGAPHLRLHGAHASAGGALPNDVAPHLVGYGARADWAVAVRGYPVGQASFLVV